MSRIVLINAHTGTDDSVFVPYIQSVEELAKTAGHEVSRFDLNRLSLRSCTGCWHCWLKSPGLCSQPDDMSLIFPQVIKAQYLILASPLVYDFPTWLMKKFQDRLIPLLLPYIEVAEGEIHHKRRYPTAYPELIVLLQKEKETTPEALKIVEEIYSRFALNFKSSLRCLITTEEPVSDWITRLN